MENLLKTLSKELQSKLADYNVSTIFIEHDELNIVSEYDLDQSFIAAIENEISN